MKLDCEIIEDLLPLYEDGVCSEKSREAVQLHLSQCSRCARLVGNTLPEPDLPELPPEERAVKRSLRKVRKRWIVSLIAVMLVLPIAYMLCKLGWNEYRNQGVCFSNLGTVRRAEQFAEDLEDGDWEAVAAEMDFSRDYDSIQEALAITLEEYEPRTTRILVDGQVYWTYTASDLAAESQKPDFWQIRILSGWDRILYLEEVFLKSIEGMEAFFDGKGYSLLDGGVYYPVELKWGKYYVNQTGYADVILRKDSPLELYHLLDMWPDALYQEALPQILLQTEKDWQTSQEWNAPYRDMTLAQYTALRREEVIQQLQALRDRGLEIDSHGAVDAYYFEGHWTVQVALTLKTPEGDVRMTLDIQEEGTGLEINGSGISHENHGNSWYEAVTNALF